MESSRGTVTVVEFGAAYHGAFLNNLSLFAACVLIWGTTWLAITFQLGTVAPEVSVSHRFLLAALVIAAWCRLRGLSLRFSKPDHLALAFMGVAMYGISYVCVYHAELHVASGLVAIGYSASPLLSTLGMRLFFGTPVTPRMALGSAFGILGISLVYWPEARGVSASSDVLLGALFTALGVLLSMSGGLMAHRNHALGLHGWPSMAWSMGYGALAALIAALAMGRTYTIDLGAPYLLSLAYLAILGSVVTFAGWLTLVGRIGVARASYVGVMAPVVALFVSTAFEGFAWHWLTAAGVAVSIAGNVLVLGG
ncbi:MAG: EamA family transporter, partial [Proteobacteria bacterium]|nr:EamA family transporter [Pseudomonadota bacterium]